MGIMKEMAYLDSLTEIANRYQINQWLNGENPTCGKGRPNIFSHFL